MADLRRRISHLQNLTERYQAQEGGRQGRILAEMVDVLREMALDVEEVTANQADLEEYLEEVDSDLITLEDEVYDDLGDHDDDDDFSELGTDDEGDAEYIELECPQCELNSFYNGELFDREGIQLTCPHCGNILFDSDEDHLVLDEEDIDGEIDD